jgi:hypothetical protein
VIHFEMAGKQGEKLQSYSSELLGWDIDAASRPNRFGVLAR